MTALSRHFCFMLIALLYHTKAINTNYLSLLINQTTTTYKSLKIIKNALWQNWSIPSE
ncbi:hypothetical protein [Moraxella lacunata]|uniref:hypothetical protein n=1 Tax=Moraxella lacunata TaxID=477 RepID=UPI003EE3D69D